MNADGRFVPVLRGLGASPGEVAGVARVLLPGAADLLEPLMPGTILVLEYASPVFFEQLLEAAALVTDQGGLTCHAAQIALELGIPCVVGTGDATTTLREGATILVDGGKGVVYVWQQDGSTR